MAIENFCGDHSIPIMTIHKSKGLEYNAVYFVGLEDSAFGILVSSQMRIDVRSLWRYLVQRSLFHSHSVSEEQTCLVHYNGIKKSMNF